MEKMCWNKKTKQTCPLKRLERDRMVVSSLLAVAIGIIVWMGSK
jgi:hypothetical protein